MRKQQIAGIALCALGLLMIYFGYHAGASELSERMADGYVDSSKWYFVGGMTAIVAGILLALFGLKGARSRTDRI